MPAVGQISATAFSPDGKRLAVAGDRTPAPVVIDLSSARVLQRMTGGGHRGGVNSIGFDPTGRWLVTGGTHD
jgi:WD40 repeat protein